MMLSTLMRTGTRAAALATLLAWPLLLAGCGDYGGGGGGGGEASSATGSDPGTTPPPAPPSDPSIGASAFETTVYPLLESYCSECHAGAGPGTPHVAHPALDTAYHAVVDNQKVNFATPASSRLVRRLVADFHHCWSSCMMDGATMEAAIVAWADALDQTGGGTVVAAGLTSQSVTLADGVEDLGAERYQDHVIAFWDFKEGEGDVAHDTSGVAPAMDLQLEGPSWLSNYGISIEDGKAQASVQSSRKLYAILAAPATGTQQYSVEAWVVPDNTDQEGPARIVSYSSGTNRRNFGLGQVLYTYDFRNRSVNPEIGANGTPSLQTYDADEDLQATLQHVVVTYDQFRGRRIYVNSRFTDDVDEFDPSRLWNWDPGFSFVLGNETTGDRQWVGKIQLVAIYDHALTDEQIRKNFDAGVGKRLILRFDVSQWVGVGSFVEFSVSELDDYSYLFCLPRLVTSNPSGFRVSNMRISVNGQVPVSGQAFVNVDQFVTTTRQQLSSLCSIVPKDQGAALDVFAIEFEILGDFENVVAVDPPPAPPPDVFGGPLPDEGVRNFARISETMAAVTGVDPNRASVRATFEDLEQQLPGGFDLRAFSSSHQVGIAKLALEYCDQLVEDAGLRTAFFGVGFDFSAPATTAFGSPASRALVVDPLIDRMLGVGLASQPGPAEVTPILDQLIDELTFGCTAATCDGERTRTVVKAACAAVLGSAATHIH